tara:strand:- start:172 stop:300 length:129 start_codon:yes stop_codon:yes gene_type:complete
MKRVLLDVERADDVRVGFLAGGLSAPQELTAMAVGGVLAEDQ